MSRTTNKPWDSWLIPGVYLRLCQDVVDGFTYDWKYITEFGNRFGLVSLEDIQGHKEFDEASAFVANKPYLFTQDNLKELFSDCLEVGNVFSGLNKRKVIGQFRSAAKSRKLRLTVSSVRDSRVCDFIVHVQDRDESSLVMPVLSVLSGNLDLHTIPPMFSTHGPWLLRDGINPTHCIPKVLMKDN